MILNVYLEGSDEPKEFNISKCSGMGAINKDLINIDLNKMNRVTIKERYVYSNNKINELRNTIEEISNCTTTSILIENVTKYTFDIIIEGKLLDVFSMFHNLGLITQYTKLRIYLENDIQLLDTLLNKTKMKGDLSKSLIIRFLSEKNGNVNYNYVFDVLRGDIGKGDLSKFLPLIFKEIYGKEHFNIKFNNMDIDKLTLKNIDDVNLKKIDSELRTKLNL